MNFNALEQSAVYVDGYDRDTPVVQWLWNVLHSLDYDMKRAFLHFATGSDRVPIKGLGKLTLTIQRNGPDQDRLPTAMTCFSRLLLPEYSSLEKLRKMLILALENSQGFGLV